MPDHGFNDADIAMTAYHIWQVEGCVHGYDKKYWHAAINARTNDFKRDFPKLSQLYYEMPNATGYGDWFRDLPLSVYSSDLSFEVYKNWLEPKLDELEPIQWARYKSKIVNGSRQQFEQLFPLLNEVWGYKYLKEQLKSRTIRFDSIDDPESTQMSTSTGMYPEWVATSQGNVVGVIEVKTVSCLSNMSDASLRQALIKPKNSNGPGLYAKAEQQPHSFGNSDTLRIAYIVLDLNSYPHLSNLTKSENETLSVIRFFFNNLVKRVEVVTEVRLWPNRTIIEVFLPT